MGLDRDVRESGEESKAKVFISYSRKDMAFADRLALALKTRGFEPFVDRRDIYAFEEWWGRIETLILRSDAVVFVLSPDAVRPDTAAMKEVALAASLNKRFAPVVFRPVEDKSVPEPVAKLNFIFFNDETRFEANVDRLAEALTTDISWIRQHTEFGEQARRWALAEGSAALLLRSPVLEQAEQWIASRPGGAPAPTAETQAFITRSRESANRRRNVLTTSLAAGLVLAVSLAGLAYWQRGIAIEQRGIAQQNEALAKQERDNATRNFNLAQKTAESLVFDIAQGLRNIQGVRAETVRRVLETARTTFEQLATSAPDDLALQRSRAVMLDEFGKTYLTLGDLDGAHKSYNDSLTIREGLTAADSTNTNWQHDLSISHNKIGEVLMAQGNLTEALEAYTNGLNISDRLAKADPGNADWQDTLSGSYNNIGEVLAAQRKLAEALQAHRGSLAIRERLAKADPNNAEWQRNLSVSYGNIGDLLRAQGNLVEALRAYRQALAILERVAKADPSNTQWQLDLSLTHGRIGSVLWEQGNLAEARQAYGNQLALTQNLAKTDPSNTTSQRELSVSYNRLGNVLVAQGSLTEALEAYTNGFTISDRLTKADPGNADWQHDLAASFSKLAGVYLKRGDVNEALIHLRKGREIMEKLVITAPENVQWKRDLIWFNDETARLERQMQEAARN
jgi:tetratricopeptide (TPR) repeat protein